MKFKASLMALALAASVGCGGSNDKGSEAKAPKKVSDSTELAKLNKISAELPSQVITRVPVVNGKPQLSKVEAIRISKSIDLKDPKAVNAAFESASTAERLTDIGVSDNLNES